MERDEEASCVAKDGVSKIDHSSLVDGPLHTALGGLIGAIEAEAIAFSFVTTRADTSRPRSRSD